jgi:hypothetical protein
MNTPNLIASMLIGLAVFFILCWLIPLNLTITISHKLIDLNIPTSLMFAAASAIIVYSSMKPPTKAWEALP